MMDLGASGELDLVGHVGIKLIWIQAGEVIVDDDLLAQRFIHGLFQSLVEVWFYAEDQRGAVHGIILEVHQHLEIPKDFGGEVLCFIEDQYERLMFLFIEVVYMLLCITLNITVFLSPRITSTRESQICL